MKKHSFFLIFKIFMNGVKPGFWIYERFMLRDVKAS